jgi:predicted DNA-binding mobile mystery protein A
MKAAQSSASRRALDRRFAEFPPAAAFAVPARGWIRAIRDALGMSAADLAARLQITQSSVSDLERSEGAHRIRLDTLERAADAMGCDLIYALVPRAGGLADTVHERALTLINDQVRAVSRAMDLEAQSTTFDDEVIDDEIRRIVASGRLWK